MKNLSETQLRSIQSIVHVVEEKLRDMEALVYFTLEHPEKGIQVTLEHDLTAEELMQFQHKAIEIKQTLQKIKDTYGFNSEKASLKRLISTKAAFMWEDITGSSFDSLKGHGAVDERLRGEYESLFDRLTKLSDEFISKQKS
ncbi:hypothetical protein G7092_02670 [Mucilaginibacter sp. HC2]|uniref:hypothetical protein n=1 Tax=Mucilaginibacter inviolabilis TaxID=2714892 RepID=UPI00140C2B38|nr:hypothetical protein [Mucilaginibacter inviolabilis]NHA02680.1 hypothetical protein [Mucilaginibacter inviolabilis]